MTYVSKFRPAAGTVLATYTCPEHGEFDAEVERDANGEAPDMIMCSADADCFGCGGQPSAPGSPHCEICDGTAHATCALSATWTPTPIACRVRRIEAVRGNWEKPEKRTYLDTRKLGEGQSMEEFRAERRRVWEEKRKADVVKFKREL